MNLYFKRTSGCPPCQTTSPIVSKIATQFGIRVIDVDTNPELTVRYQVRSVPTFINTRGGRLQGVQSESALRSFYAT